MRQGQITSHGCGEDLTKDMLHKYFAFKQMTPALLGSAGRIEGGVSSGKEATQYLVSQPQLSTCVWPAAVKGASLPLPVKAPLPLSQRPLPTHASREGVGSLVLNGLDEMHSAGNCLHYLP